VREHSRQQFVAEGGARLGREEVRDVVSSHLFHAVQAGESLPGLVEEERPAVQIRHADEVGRGLDDGRQAPVLDVSELARADVAVDAQEADRIAAAVTDRRRDQLDIPPDAGLAPGAELDVRDPISVERRLEPQARGVALVSGQLARGAAHRLLGAVAVEPLGRRVPQRHAVVQVGSDHRVRHDLDHALVEPVA
jgi:hypothetical protein